jgi:hypothetical protein
MSRQIDGVWNTNPDLDRVERQRESEMEDRERDDRADSYDGVDNRGGHPNEVLGGSQPPSAGLRASSGESHPSTICTGGGNPAALSPAAVYGADPPAMPPVQQPDWDLPWFPNEPDHNALLGPWDGEL